MSQLHDAPAADAFRTPPPETAAPPAIRLHPGTRSATAPSPTHRAFRRGFLDRKDPFEASGRLMRSFTFSDSFDLEGDPPQAVVDEIQIRLIQQLADGNLADTQLDVIDFDDAAISDEPARRFFVTHTTTRRKTVVTVNTYFRTYGDHVYYSVRSYVLPLLNFWKMLLVMGVFFFALRSASEMGLQLLTLAILVGLVFHLRKFIIDVAAGEPVSVALRKQYPGSLNSGTFDDDDTIAFLKTNVSLTLRTVAEVLEKHGIDTTGLRGILQGIGSVTINTGGGSIIGAAIGGIANRVAAEVRT